MTNPDIIYGISLLHEKMRKLTLDAGVPESLYNRVSTFDGTLTTFHLKERLEFLQGLETAEYAELEVVWALRPEEVWVMYKAFGQHNLAEQVLLRKARKTLKKVWEKRYEVKRDNNSESPVGELVGP